jgi:hypothetical protein
LSTEITFLPGTPSIWINRLTFRHSIGLVNRASQERLSNCNIDNNLAVHVQLAVFWHATCMVSTTVQQAVAGSPN